MICFDGIYAGASLRPAARRCLVLFAGALLATMLSGCLFGGRSDLAPVVYKSGSDPQAVSSHQYVPAKTQVAPRPAQKPGSYLAQPQIRSARIGSSNRSIPQPVATKPQRQAVVAQSTPTTPLPEPRRPQFYRHRVEAGETVYVIANRFGVAPRSLIEANQLDAPFTLSVGQFLMVPKPHWHWVRAGENLYSVSRLYRIDMASLARENQLETHQALRVGQQLRIPYSHSAPRPDVTAQAVTPQTVSSRPSENREIPSGNTENVPIPITIDRSPEMAEHSARQSFLVRLSESLERAILARPDRGDDTRSASPPTAAAPTATQKAATLQPREPKPVKRRPPPPRAGPRFAWPANGEIISSFGPKDSGLHNDGINIAVVDGSAVRAAENGVVVYVGNELKGYGNLLLLRHAGGWTSAYAHNQQVTVAVGDLVQRGDVLGYAGRTGHVSRPQVHFELRRGRTAVDPMHYLEGTGQTAKAGRKGKPAS